MVKGGKTRVDNDFFLVPPLKRRTGSHLLGGCTCSPLLTVTEWLRGGERKPSTGGKGVKKKKVCGMFTLRLCIYQLQYYNNSDSVLNAYKKIKRYRLYCITGYSFQVEELQQLDEGRY